MNREELKALAASRRTNESVPQDKAVVWNCEYCLRPFMTENGFMKHFCQERERIEYMRTPQGQAAYSYYGEWMRAQKRSVPAIDRFMASRQYTFFVKFADWVERVAIPDTDRFIKLMVDSKTQPVLWCRDTTFAMYLEWYDGVRPPEVQFLETYEVLLKLAADLEVPVSDVYTALGPREIAKLVRRRKISPWLLTVSRKFLLWVQSLDNINQDIVKDAINLGTFAMKLNKNPELSQMLRQSAEELGV